MSELFPEAMKTAHQSLEKPQSEKSTPPVLLGDLLNVEIKNENTALNTLVGFLGVAQKRGSFAINESAKIYECIQVFCRAPRTPATTTLPPVPELNSSSTTSK